MKTKFFILLALFFSYISYSQNLMPINGGGCQQWVYLDNDQDGFGVLPAVCQTNTQQSLNYSDIAGDCNDNNATINPYTVWYIDADGDTFGSPVVSSTNPKIQCAQPAGYVLNNADCNDNLANSNPLTIWYLDSDGDGEGSTTVLATQCVQPATNAVLSHLDCDDNDPSIKSSTTWYVDADGDGYGENTNGSIVSCSQPTTGTYVNNNLDACPGISGTFQGCTIPNPNNFSVNQNYIVTISPKIPVSDITQITNDADLSMHITYFDGLGRPIQQIANKQSASGRDIINHIEYDAFARQAKDYLPFVSASNTMGFDNNAKANTLSFYSNPTLASSGNTNFEATNFPYSEKLFDNSPLNRIFKQSAPGDDWALPTGPLSSDHTTKFDYQTNLTNEVRKFKVVFETGTTENHHLEINGFYDSNELLKTVIKNENWTLADGLNKTTQEFKDKEGKVILKRTFNNSDTINTYYVYDVYGNLSYIVPPTASDAIDQTYGTSPLINRNYPWTTLAEVDGELATQYDKLFSDYKNEFILDQDLFNKYGGQGGFSLNTNSDNTLSLSININTLQPLELKKGTILSLKDLGDFKDVELGRISGEGYQYTFIIRDNSLIVRGRGTISSLNTTLIGSANLTYNTNYSWASILDLKDPKKADEFITRYSAINNEDILTTNFDNDFGATGGLNITVDANDTVAITINLATNTPLSLKTGLIIPLTTERRISDRELKDITTENFKYQLSIKENSLYIYGSGDLTSLNEATIVFPTINPTIPQNIIEGLCYEYHYDYRNRLIEKRVPGKGWEYLVYDKLDRIVLTQDPNARLNNKWLFSKYDAFDRPVYSGQFVYNSPAGNTDITLRLELQGLVTNNSIINENRSTTTFQSGNANINYTNSIFPNANNEDFQVFTVNYYDDYSFTTVSVSGVTSANSIPVMVPKKTLNTGSLIRVLDTDEWICNIIAYDDKDRPIASRADNNYLKTVDVNQIVLDFIGKVNQTTATHNKLGATTNLITVDKFTYDNANRLLIQTQKIGSQAEELINFNKYDELGSLIQKKVGGPAPAGSANYSSITTSLQNIDYAYNVRGWLKKINDPDSALNNSLFAFKLNYNSPSLPGTTALYNGNISEASWKTGNDNKIRSYTYSYDDLNRLKQANYIGNYQLAANAGQTENYTEGNLEYDKNGNITHLERYGLKTSGNIIDIIDNLSYQYSPRSNKLIQVIDYSNEKEGFKDDTNTGDDYTYDINGNIKTDTNKHITNIEYNHLNLPTKIVFDNQDPLYSMHPKVITYIYDADGTKLAKTVTTDLTVSTTTEYANNYIYENNMLHYFSQPEGYVANNNGIFSYIYQYKDHLGNVRLSYKKSATGLEIVEENNYYPFGSKQKGYNNIVAPSGDAMANKKLYNGKEFQDELGLNITSMDWRQYDNSLGRYCVIDALCELQGDWSPYRFAYDNPNYWIDPSGLFEQDESNNLSKKKKKGDPDNPIILKEVVIKLKHKTNYYSIMNDGFGGFGEGLHKIKPFGGYVGIWRATNGLPYQPPRMNYYSNWKSGNGTVATVATSKLMAKMLKKGTMGVTVTFGLVNAYKASKKDALLGNKGIKITDKYTIGSETGKSIAKTGGSYAGGELGVYLGAQAGLVFGGGVFDEVTVPIFAIGGGIYGGIKGEDAVQALFDAPRSKPQPNIYGSNANIICFLAGTKITMSDESLKNIEDVKNGDEIKTFNEKNNSIENKEVLNVSISHSPIFIIIKFEDGTINMNTPSHPYYTKNKGWSSFDQDEAIKKYGIRVDKLTEGDSVYKYENGKMKELKIISIEQISREVKTFNLSNVKDNHNFFANGILVHNRS